jgi:predicted dienelactone hydrolase
MLDRGHSLRALVALAVCASLTFAQGNAAALGASGALLPPGPHAVGFRSSWVLDHGRTYRTGWDDGATYGAVKSPRPVLVLEWYPAEPPPADATSGDAGFMPHASYLSLPTADARLASLAEALRVHLQGIFAEQVLGAPEGMLDVELQRALQAPTSCVLDAAPAPGPFPVVLYHSGAGSSFEDNAALCEFLASHGYLVLGSAYLEADGSDLGIDGGRGSAEDAQCLLRHARTLPHADADRVALVGHSAGAQAFLRFAAQPGCPADALVLLDTTQDYYGLTLPLHEVLVREATEGRAHLTQPMLVAASPEAMYALCDTLVHAERCYLTVPDLGHDEFISQGLQRLQRIERDAQRGAVAPGEEGEAARAPAVRASYRALCEHVLAFLDAQLRGEDAAFAAQLERDRARPWTHAEPRLVLVPRGASGPEPWDPASEAPPTPRQFVRLMLEQGAEPACTVLERFRGGDGTAVPDGAPDDPPDGPLHSSTMLAGSLLHELSERGRKDEARRYLAALKAIPVDALGLFQFLADISSMQGKREQALHFLRLACELDPENAELASSLRALEASPER